MLDINYIRNHTDAVRDAVSKKHASVDLDRLLELDDMRKSLQHQTDTLRAEQKAAGKARDIERAKALKNDIQTLDEQMNQVMEEYQTLMLQVPQILHADVPDGESDEDNVEVKTVGELPSFDFEPKDHVQLMMQHDMIDVERAVKLAGARNYFLKGDGALLEQAVLQYAYQKIASKGFVPMAVPQMVDTACLQGTGYFPGGEDDAYHLERDDKWLIATAEIPLTAYHSDEVLDEADLPKTYVGLSSCYRREAGTYGKDTRGLYRVHQFSKVEQVVILPADVAMSNHWHQAILANAEEILQDLGIPYRLLQLCAGDLALGKYNSHDLECWMPSRESYGETHSATSFLDFQARRLNLRYRTVDGEIKHCYTLNNTAIATPRFLIALIENNQQADGSIVIPEVLRPYMGGREVIAKQ